MRGADSPTSGVDLRLAVNYLPGCVCLLKTLGLSLALCALDAFGVQQGLFLTGLVLALDRHAVPPRIFDGSSVLLAVAAAHVAYVLQRHCPPGYAVPPGLYYALHCEWALFSGWMLWRDLARAPRASRLREHLALDFVVGHMALCPFVPRPGELLALRCARYAGYAALSVAWVYAGRLAGLRPRLPCPACFAVYFSPVLYAPPPLAALHAGCAVLLAAVHLAPAPAPTSAPPRDPEAPPPSAAPAAAPDDAAALEEFERVFRQAQQARGALCP